MSDKSVAAQVSVGNASTSYDVEELARIYGLSKGQARALIEIHGRSRATLDAIMKRKSRSKETRPEAWQSGLAGQWKRARSGWGTCLLHAPHR